MISSNCIGKVVVDEYETITTCNRCGITSTEERLDGWLQICDVGSCGSPFGDGSDIFIDLCPQCYFDVLGDFNK